MRGSSLQQIGFIGFPGFIDMPQGLQAHGVQEPTVIANPSARFSSEGVFALGAIQITRNLAEDVSAQQVNLGSSFGLGMRSQELLALRQGVAVATETRQQLDYREIRLGSKGAVGETGPLRLKGGKGASGLAESVTPQSSQLVLRGFASQSVLRGLLLVASQGLLRALARRKLTTIAVNRKRRSGRWCGDGR